MNSLLQQFIARIMPFFILGIILVLFVVGLYLMIHLLILGALVGLILFIFAWIRDKFFISHAMVPKQKRPASGRTIDHDDIP